MEKPEMIKKLETQYIEAKNSIDERKKEYAKNSDRESLILRIGILKDELQKMDDIHQIDIANEEREVVGITKIFKDLYDGNNKEIELEQLVLNFRVTKSLVPINKKTIVNTLIVNEKVHEGIGTFKKPFLRKLAEVGILPVDSYRWDEKINMSIKILNKGDNNNDRSKTENKDGVA